MVTKDKVTEALDDMVKNVADQEGFFIGCLRVDGGAEVKGRFSALAQSLRIKVETNPPYVPQGSVIAERGYHQASS